jgi:phosphate transport system substrate-binding protein
MEARASWVAALAAVCLLSAAGCEGAAGSAGPDAPDVSGGAADAPAPALDVVDLPAPVFTLASYPRVDGSTSNIPLARVIACELLGVPWRWEFQTLGPDSAFPEKTVLPAPTTPAQEELAAGILERTVHAKTHQAWLNLVDGTRDLILVASDASDDERAYAAERGVALEWEAVALDALVFLVNQENPIEGLTTEQIRQIYMAELTKWSEVGGPAGRPIDPYVRPRNSGSQELMQELVLRELEPPVWPEDMLVMGMGGLVDRIKEDPDALGYSVHYYVTYQYPIGGMRTIAVDGSAPSSATLADGSYPHVAPVWLAWRADLDPASGAARLRDWLLSPGGQAVVALSGYVPARAGAAAE